MHDPLILPGAPEFDAPLALLEACHGRIRDHLARLPAIAEGLADPARRDRARFALARVAAYFETGLLHHHADEEESLFPRLLALRPDLAGAIAGLQAEHDALDPLHAELARLAASFGRGDHGDLAALRDLGPALARAYAPHLEAEEARILPAAGGLAPEALKTVGAEMRARRGVG